MTLKINLQDSYLILALEQLSGVVCWFFFPRHKQLKGWKIASGNLQRIDLLGANLAIPNTLGLPWASVLTSCWLSKPTRRYVHKALQLITLLTTKMVPVKDLAEIFIKFILPHGYLQNIFEVGTLFTCIWNLHSYLCFVFSSISPAFHTLESHGICILKANNMWEIKSREQGPSYLLSA